MPTVTPARDGAVMILSVVLTGIVNVLVADNCGELESLTVAINVIIGEVLMFPEMIPPLVIERPPAGSADQV